MSWIEYGPVECVLPQNGAAVCGRCWGCWRSCDWALNTRLHPQLHPALHSSDCGRTWSQKDWVNASDHHPANRKTLISDYTWAILQWRNPICASLTWMTRYRGGSRAILVNSEMSSLKRGLLSASIIQPGWKQWHDDKGDDEKSLRTSNVTSPNTLMVLLYLLFIGIGWHWIFLIVHAQN